jgi:putative intracellular protease/amidase
MSKTLPRKAIIAVSSFNGAIYPGGHKTGLFLTEALHPFEVLVAAGFEVDLASENGSFGFDFNSLTPPFLSGSDRAVYNNPNYPFMLKLKSQLKKASDLKRGQYGVFFASAGHSALYDYPTAKGLQAIAADIWDRGGIVGAVCHGAAIMPGIIDSKTGKSIIEGKTVFDYSKLAFPRAQFDPEAVYVTMTAVAAGEIDTYRNLEPKSMLAETKRNIETPWNKKVKDGLGTRPASLQKSYEMKPETPVYE